MRYRPCPRRSCRADPRADWLAAIPSNKDSAVALWRSRYRSVGRITYRHSSLAAIPIKPSKRERGQSLNRCGLRSEEHTFELQSLMRISYAVFCLKKKKLHIIK